MNHGKTESCKNTIMPTTRFLLLMINSVDQRREGLYIQ